PTHPGLMLRTFVAPESVVTPDAAGFAAALRAAAIDARVDVPVIPLDAGRVAIRLSIAWYVSADDVDRLLGVVDALARS
ncbi:MAG TPA: hypothetical protein VGS61_03475, partial [Acidimicrobiales bacterium]|nr:hypothetical protein [Acidimicrobiales bacterium]